MKTNQHPELKVVIPLELRPSFVFIWSADLERIAKRLKKEHTFWSQPKIEKLIVEYRKFLSLILLSEKQIPMCNELVDEVWHAHVLFTEDYAKFCQQAFGGFLHHEPADSQTAENYSTSADFVSEYQRIFGALDSVWFGPIWLRVLNKFKTLTKISRPDAVAKLCLATNPAKLCLATGPAKCCLPTGSVKFVS